MPSWTAHRLKTSHILNTLWGVYEPIWSVCNEPILWLCFDEVDFWKKHVHMTHLNGGKREHQGQTFLIRWTRLPLRNSSISIAFVSSLNATSGNHLHWTSMAWRRSASVMSIHRGTCCMRGRKDGDLAHALASVAVAGERHTIWVKRASSKSNCSPQATRRKFWQRIWASVRVPAGHAASLLHSV